MYTVYIGYAGINYYVVYKDGEEVYYGWSATDILEKFGIPVDEMKRIKEGEW